MGSMSAIRADKIVKKGYIEFLAHLQDDKSIVPSTSLVLVDCMFLEVFPDDLSEMHLEHSNHL